MARGALDVTAAMFGVGGGDARTRDQEVVRVPYSPAALMALQDEIDKEKAANVEAGR